MASALAPTTPSIRAVLFDYGMVLSGPPDPTAKLRMREILNDAGEEPFQKAYWHYRDDYDRGTLNARAYWNNVANDLGLILTAEETDALIAADVRLWTAPNQPMIDWALELRRRGIRTGVLSNLGDAMEAGVRQRFDWMGGFDHHTFSHRLGVAKPDPAIYAHAVAGLGVAAAEILFLDDREENIAAARLAGMQAIQYNNHHNFLAEAQSLGFGDLLAPTVSEPLTKHA